MKLSTAAKKLRIGDTKAASLLGKARKEQAMKTAGYTPEGKSIYHMKLRAKRTHYPKRKKGIEGKSVHNSPQEAI